MIFKVESKILKWMSENILLIALGAAVLLSLILRVSLRGFYTSDADLCLIPWYEAIKANGGIRGLAVPVEGLNYNFPYQFCIAIMTYIPIYPLYAYKILSAIFDYLLAFMVGKIVFEVAQENKKEKAVFAAIAVMLSPLVFLDSSAWAQCDSIYTFFVMWAIYYLIKEKYLPAFIVYGVAFAFKFQAVFILPFFLFYYFTKRKFSIIYFGLIPVMMTVLSLPALVQGRSIIEMITIYTDNTSLHQSISNNYPSFWRILNEGSYMDSYDTLKTAAILFTVVVLGCFVTFWVRHGVELTNEHMILMAFAMTYTTVFFLPAMHDRYGYVYEILAIIIAFMLVKTAPLAIAMICTSLTMYGVFLYHQNFNETTVAVINLIIYLAYMIIVNKELLKESEHAI